jgi:L-ascorbate metabolism protein UlaG (beta-lactamase superfamily)
MTHSYRKEMALLAGRAADAAFLPVDPRLEGWFYLGADDFMKQADARRIFPMHFWGDFSVCRKLKEHPCSVSYRDRIVNIEEKGQSFLL